RVAVLEEVFLPERAAAQDSGGAGLQGHLHLLEIIRVIDARRQQYPGPLAGRVQRLEVAAELVVRLVAQRAGELRLVDVAEPAELPGRFDDRLGLPVQEAGIGFLL